MKWIFTALLALLVLGLAPATDFTVSQPVTFEWESSNEVTPDLSFNLYKADSPTAPRSDWIKIITIPGSNTWQTVIFRPGKTYWTVTASNFWGESDFSNIVGTPATVLNLTNVQAHLGLPGKASGVTAVK